MSVHEVAIVLRFLHIAFAIAWLGAVFYAVGVLGRALPRVDPPARKAVMRRLLPVGFHYIPMVAVFTIAFGALLYAYLGDFAPERLLGDLRGQLLFTALLISLAMFAIGMLVVFRSGKVMLVHLEEEACTHLPLMGALSKRFGVGNLVLLVLGVVVLGLMVTAPRI